MDRKIFTNSEEDKIFLTDYLNNSIMHQYDWKNKSFLSLSDEYKYEFKMMMFSLVSYRALFFKKCVSTINYDDPMLFWKIDDVSIIADHLENILKYKKFNKNKGDFVNYFFRSFKYAYMQTQSLDKGLIYIRCYSIKLSKCRKFFTEVYKTQKTSLGLNDFVYDCIVNIDYIVHENIFNIREQLPFFNTKNAFKYASKLRTYFLNKKFVSFNGIDYGITDNDESISDGNMATSNDMQVTEYSIELEDLFNDIEKLIMESLRKPDRKLFSAYFTNKFYHEFSDFISWNNSNHLIDYILNRNVDEKILRENTTYEYNLYDRKFFDIEIFLKCFNSHKKLKAKDLAKMFKRSVQSWSRTTNKFDEKLSALNEK